MPAVGRTITEATGSRLAALLATTPPAELFPVLDMSRPPDLPEMCRCVIIPDDVASDDWRYQRMELTMTTMIPTPLDKLRQLKKETLVRRVRQLQSALIANTNIANAGDTRIEELTVRIEDLKRVHAGQQNEKTAEIEGLREQLQVSNRRLGNEREEWRYLAYRESEQRLKMDHALQMSKIREPKPEAVDTFGVAKADEEMDLHEGSTRVVLTRPKQGGPIKVEVRKPNRATEVYEADRVELQGLQ